MHHSDGGAIGSGKSTDALTVDVRMLQYWPELVDLVLRLGKGLADGGFDAGPETIAWHLEHHHGHRVSRSTISRHLTAAGLVTPEPKKRPKSSYIRFEASMPNETWQSDFPHYRLTHHDGRPGTDVKIVSWFDDCTCYALHVTAHPRLTTSIVLATFRQAPVRHGTPTSTLTDNGMVYTVRLAGHGRLGRKNSFEAELSRHHIVQKNSCPGHPITCGKAERFQQTMKSGYEPSPSSRAPPPSSRRSSSPSATSTTTGDRTAPCPTGAPGDAHSIPKALPGPATDPVITSGSGTTASTRPAQ